MERGRVLVLGLVWGSMLGLGGCGKHGDPPPASVAPATSTVGPSTQVSLAPLGSVDISIRVTPAFVTQLKTPGRVSGGYLAAGIFSDNLPSSAIRCFAFVTGTPRNLNLNSSPFSLDSASGHARVAYFWNSDESIQMSCELGTDALESASAVHDLLAPIFGKYATSLRVEASD